MLDYNYVSPLGEQNLKHYKYVGGESSLAYKYIISPSAQWCVDHIIPTNVAPNVITSIGFMLDVFAHLLLWYYLGDDLEGDVPPWVCCVLGVSHLLYLLLDNVDGKQARKTGSSSPLGLLFDHGADALTVNIIGFSFMQVIQLGKTWRTITSYAIASVPFFLATWEEYYTGGLFLPIINGASEGNLFVGILLIFTGFTGSLWWKEKSFLGIPRNMVVLYGSIAGLIMSVYHNVRNVRTKRPDRHTESTINTIPVIINCATIYLVYNFSISDVGTTHMRYLYYFGAINFARLCTSLQLAHVADEKFEGFRKTSFFYYFVLLTNTFVGYYRGLPLVNEGKLLIILCIASLLTHLHLIVNVILQFTRVLDIKAFSIKPKVK
eukprot:TRINITY_DN9196_c0_g2_i8.p1 TRINITY_DN9196_c0_g2~~TRINITY_DN9196_c0_g2_i8.p1  ORF type:complete len:378 (-),score=41.26 TRINITY_DN9196_c0_g2_i8:231-1364(-)